MAADLTLESSSEFLRLALPLMAKYRIPVTPKNFTVWFDYVAGSSTALSEMIDGLIQDEKPIDESMTDELYERFYGDAAQTQVIAAHEKVEHILAELFSSLSNTNEEILRYEDTLNECTENLNDEVSHEQLRTVVSGLVESTNRMHEGSTSLQENLEASKKEADELRAELEKVRAESKIDPMTGLLNRKGFELDLAGLARESEYTTQNHVVMIADIDKFKNINDSYGHLFGDKVIKIVATALSKLTKGKDLVARFGGEEFVVFLPDTTLKGASVVAENIRRSLERGRVYNPKTKIEIERVTVSIGVTAYSVSEEINTAIARADEALYAAKASGRNCVKITEHLSQPQLAIG